MISVNKLENWPPNCKLSQHDAYHMYQNIGKNVIALMKNHESEHCPYVIIVNHETGERIKIEFE